MNDKQIISRISPAMLRDMPDQVSMVLNQVIDYINELERNK